MKKLYFLFSIITIFFFFSDACLSQLKTSISQNQEKLNKKLAYIFPSDRLIENQELPIICRHISLALRIILLEKYSPANNEKIKNVPLLLYDRLKLFVNWLENIKCVKKVDFPFLSGNEYDSVLLLASNPAKIKMKIEFLMADQTIESRRFTFQINQKGGFKLIDFSLK